MIDEGYIKFDSSWQPSAALDGPEIEELVLWRRPLYDAGLIGYYADIGIGYGNLSIRIGDSNQFIVSGTQTGHLAEPGGEHFALVTEFDIDSNKVVSTGAIEASSESMTHAAIYQTGKQIRAVAHVHCDKLWLGLKDKVPTTLRGVDYGTPAMAREFTRLFRETDFRQTGIAVMAGHDGGLISAGHNMQEAAERILSHHKQD